jgi:DnaJ-class molecular chaperone
VDVLGLQLSQVETEKDVKKACWKAASLWHPDKHGNSLEAKRRFEEIIQAYASICAELGFKTSFRT